MSTTVAVQGMTCQHCVVSITEELQEIENVTGVSVDLDPQGTSRVHIEHTGELDDAAVRAAVDEAGYTLS